MNVYVNKYGGIYVHVIEFNRENQKCIVYLCGCVKRLGKNRKKGKYNEYILYYQLMFFRLDGSCKKYF